MEERDRAFLDETGGVLTDAALSVLPMLQPKPVEVSLGEISEWKPETYPHPVVLATVAFSEGPSGSLYFLLASGDASVIVDLMLGGEGSAERSMNEESLDALKELMNQFLGVTAQALRDRYETPFGFEQVEVHSLQADIDLSPLLGGETLNRLDLNLAIEGAEPGVLAAFLPVETLAAMVAAAEGKVGGGGEAPAPEAEAVAAAEEEEEVEVTAAEPQPAELAAAIQEGNVGLILDIELPIVIRLGNAEMTLQEILQLSPGALIELDKGVDEPVELLVNDKTIAKGEVVVVEGNFAFRVTNIESRLARIRSLV